MGCKSRNVDRYGRCKSPLCSSCRSKPWPEPPETLLETEVRHLKRMGVTVKASDLGKMGQRYGCTGVC